MRTIAAISTAHGTGGIGIIRISGDKAIEIADKVFKSFSKKKLCDTPGYKARYGKIIDGEEVIDEAIALVFVAPNSYTGENVVELSCHGGMYVTKRALRAVLSAGAFAAEPGEFTKRSFLNGKVDLTEAEAVMDIISAKGKQAARAALAGREGALYDKIEQVKSKLLSLAAHLSAWADYPDEDIPEVERENLLQDLDLEHSKLISLMENYDTGKALREGVNTVIAGRPNVGKSTLMNLLSGCERSIVTEIPGTTRDVIEETVMLGEIPLRLADTAGIRETLDPVESIGVGLAKNKVERAGLVLAVFDASMELNEDDKILIDSLKDIPAIAIINKSDLTKKIDDSYIKDNIKQIVYISAASGEGLEKLKNAVVNIVGTAKLDPSEAMLATERQYNAVERTVDCLKEAKNALSYGMTLDAVTVLIEGAIQELLELTGERASEAVVEGVFSRFCVGK